MGEQDRRKWYPGLDWIKSIGIILVVWYHSDGLWLNKDIIRDFPIYSFFLSITMFAVPFFILSNGFLLSVKQPLLNSSVRKGMHFVGLLLFWSGVVVLCKMWVVDNSLSLWVMSKLHQQTTQLWYLGWMALVSFFSPLLYLLSGLDRVQKKYLMWIIFIVGLLSPFLNTFIRFFIWVLTGISYGVEHDFVFVFMPLGSMAVIYTYLIFGIFRGYDVNLRVAIGLLVFSLCWTQFELWFDLNYLKLYNDFVYGNYNDIFVALAVITLFPWILKVTRKPPLFLEWFAKNSLGVYVLHMPILIIIQKMQIWTEGTIPQRLMVAILACLIALAISATFRKLPGLKHLVVVR